MAARSALPLPLEKWPEVDKAAWREAAKLGDEYEPGGNLNHLGERSRENAQNAYGRYLEFLRREGRQLVVPDVSDRVVIDDIRDFARELWSQLAPYTVVGVLGSLGSAFKALAPKASRALLNKLLGRLERRAKSIRNIADNLLSPRELEAIGMELMDRAEASGKRIDWRASMFRDGLLIAFLANCPLRVGAVADMLLGVHLVVEGETVQVHFPELPNRKRRIENVPLPDRVAARWLRYLDFYHPKLAGADRRGCNEIWLSWLGQPMDRVTLSKCIKARIYAETRKYFTAHMFRHSAATFIAEEAPERALMIAAVLGHSGFRVAKEHYIKSDGVAQYKRYHELVAELQRRHEAQVEEDPNPLPMTADAI